MKKALSILLSALLILSVSVVCVSADETGSLSASISVTIADKNGETVVGAQKITVTDTDADGSLTVNDVLYAAHEAFYEGGAAAGYGTAVSQYGLSLAKLWGTANGGSYGYYINNASAWSLTDPVTDGDYVAAFVYTDPIGWSDHYSYFDTPFKETVTDKAVTFTYLEAGYDADWNPVTLPVDSAIVTVDGKAIPFSTNAQGEVHLSFSKEGVYRISATVEGKRLVAPICILTVTDAPSAPLIGDADKNGKVEITDATHIQRYLVALVAEDEIDKATSDADGDGKVNILDATRIQRYLAGIIPAL